MRNVCKRNARTRCRNDRKELKLLDRITHALRVAKVYGIAFEPFHSLSDIHPADRRSNDVLHVSNVQPEPRCAFAINIHIHIAPAGHTLRVDRRCSFNPGEDSLQILADSLNDTEIGSGDLDPHRCLDASRKHVDPGLNRHDPGIRETGIIDDTIELRP